MPVTVHEVTGATQFTGIADAGLFDDTIYGGQSTQVRVNFLSYHGTGTAPSLTVTLIDPDNSGNDVLLFSATANDYAVMSPFLIPTAADGDSWNLKFETTSKDATGWFSIDWDAVATEG